jgi:hypothetical protein
MRHPLRQASGWIVAACLSVYLATVAIASQRGEPGWWWPYWWLWLLVFVFVVSSVVWALTWREPRRSDEIDVGATAAFSTGALPTGQETVVHDDSSESGVVSDERGAVRASEPIVAAPVPDDEAVYDSGGWQFGDMRARVRASDLRLVVTYKPNGQMVGVLTPSRGGYKAMHVQVGELGWYPTVGKAMRAIWEAD